MRKILVTGGTVFVSKYIAEYFVKQGEEVYVINRNTREQSDGVTLIQADRHAIGDLLHSLHFDVVIDTAYTGEDVNALLDALGSFDDYVLISSSAVYANDAPQPFTEETKLGPAVAWGKYGLDKMEAEEALLKRKPNAYILRPAYIYGQMNNVYREAFVFDCALSNRPFYIPNDGEQPLQFIHIHDVARFIEILLDTKPIQHIYNLGNPNAVSMREWVRLCYQIVGKEVTFINVQEPIDQKNYVSFSDYEYYLDVTKQSELMKDVIPLIEGLQEAFLWYQAHEDQVKKKPYLDYITQHLVSRIL